VTAMLGSPLCPPARPVAVASIPDSLEHAFASLSWWRLGTTWHDPDLGGPIAAPLQRCAELLGVDLATISVAVANVEPYLRADGTWQPNANVQDSIRAGRVGSAQTGPPGKACFTSRSDEAPSSALREVKVSAS
jgi:hypothetical protein